MIKGTKIKWVMLITLLIADILITAALAYSTLVSRVLITGNDPYILNVAMIIAIIDFALWCVTLFLMYEVKTDSTLTQRVITLERILMEKGLSSRK
jgi:hypothetical protein